MKPTYTVTFTYDELIRAMTTIEQDKRRMLQFLADSPDKTSREFWEKEHAGLDKIYKKLVESPPIRQRGAA